MRACVHCGKKLTFWNVPSKSIRVLKDGNEICASCIQSLYRIMPNLELSNYDKKEFIAAVEGVINQINNKVDKVNSIQFGNPGESGIKKTLKDLYGILNDSEELYGVIQVFDEKNRNGGFFVTDRRIICICKGLGVGSKTTDFPYSKISSIDFNSGFLKSKITIHVSGNTSEYSAVDNDLAIQIVNLVREKLVQKSDEPIAAKTQGNDDIFEQIEKLSLLKEKGILSEEEFKSKKDELLKRI